jgi:ribosomal-protein-serine acetyltransferase
MINKANASSSIDVAPGLEIRLPEVGSAQELFALVDCNRHSLREWLPWLDFDRTIDDQTRYIEIMRQKFFQSGILTGCIFFENRIAGIIGFNTIDWANHSAAIGYWLGSEFQKKGIMVKCCRALISHGFFDLGLHRIEIRCGVTNLQSRRIPERLNLRLEGTLRDAEFLYDHYTSLNVYSALASEWSR